MKVSCCLGI